MIARALRLAVMATLATGCVVPQARYDEARSALAVEQEAHRRTNAELYRVAMQVDALQKKLSLREQELAQRSREMADKELVANVAIREQEAATELVEQLRGELARVGDHLRAFAEQKRELAAKLDGAEARAKRLEQLEKSASRQVAVVRDVSLLLGEPITTGEVELGIAEGRPVLAIEHASAFVAGSGDLQPGTRSAAGAVARAARLHPELSIRVSRRAVDEQAALSELRKVAEYLESEGVPAARIEVAVEKSGDSGEGPLRIWLL